MSMIILVDSIHPIKVRHSLRALHDKTASHEDFCQSLLSAIS